MIEFVGVIVGVIDGLTDVVGVIETEGVNDDVGVIVGVTD